MINQPLWGYPKSTPSGGGFFNSNRGGEAYPKRHKFMPFHAPVAGGMVYALLLTIVDQKLFPGVWEAMDKINDRWGEFVITPALMMDMEDIILDRIAFGGVKELEEMYAK